MLESNQSTLKAGDPVEGMLLFTLVLIRQGPDPVDE